MLVNRRSILLRLGGLLFAVSAFVLSSDFAVAAEPARPYVCTNPDSSALAWGQAPTGCDADQFGDITRIQYIYGDYVFDRRGSTDESRAQYMTNMQNLIRKMAHDYYMAHKPQASKEGAAAFERAILTVSHQESFMSHYRIGPDGRYKLMTGDKNISHGVMQVNQNFFAGGDLDSSFDLVGNITSALDTFMIQWDRAAEQDCYKQAIIKIVDGKKMPFKDQLEIRAQSAYSAYNGGPGAICRFADQDSPYKGHDDEFKSKFEEQRWARWNRDPKRPVKLNIKCLVEGDDLCAVAQSHRGEFLRSRPLVFANGLTCLTSDGTNLNCAKDLRLFSCLAKVDPSVLENTPIKFDKPTAKQKVKILDNREELCSKAVVGLYKLGSLIVVKKQTNLRNTIGGVAIDMIPADRVYQILDFDVRLGKKTERYYRIKVSNGNTGWIYAGENSDFADWAVVATSEETLAAQQRIAARHSSAQPASASAPVAAGVTASAASSAQSANVSVLKLKSPVVGLGASLLPIKIPAGLVLHSIPDVTLDERKSADGPTNLIPRAGDTVEVVFAGGISPRDSLQSRIAVVKGKKVRIQPNPLPLLRAGTRVKVEKVITQGQANEIYLQIRVSGKPCFLYAGHTHPELAVDKWVKVWN